jgi:hypothetical protein
MARQRQVLFAFEASGITTGVIYYDIDGLFNELPLGLSRKKGRLRRCAGRPRSLNLVQSRYPLASLFCGGQGTGCGFSACRQGGLFDEISNGLRLRHIHGVAALTSTTVEPARSDIARWAAEAAGLQQTSFNSIAHTLCADGSGLFCHASQTRRQVHTPRGGETLRVCAKLAT